MRDQLVTKGITPMSASTLLDFPIDSPDDRIAKLEWRVVEAAVAKRKAEREAYPDGLHLSVSHYAFETYVRAEEAACDALIAAREEAQDGHV